MYRIPYDIQRQLCGIIDYFLNPESSESVQLAAVKLVQFRDQLATQKEMSYLTESKFGLASMMDRAMVERWEAPPNHHVTGIKNTLIFRRNKTYCLQVYTPCLG
jgi:hypothetical protein